MDTSELHLHMNELYRNFNNNRMDIKQVIEGAVQLGMYYQHEKLHNGINEIFNKNEKI